MDPTVLNSSLLIVGYETSIRVTLGTNQNNVFNTTVNQLVTAINNNTDASKVVTATVSGVSTSTVWPVDIQKPLELAGGSDGGAVAGVTESATLTVLTKEVIVTGTLKVALTNPAKTVNVPVVAGDTPAQVAAKIVAKLGTVAGYSVVVNNVDGITFTSTQANTNVADLTVTVTDL